MAFLKFLVFPLFWATFTLSAVVPPRLPKVILDVDPGIDDADALLMFFAQSQNHSVVAVTISQGNTFLSNATHNAFRIMRLCDQLSIPVFQGDGYTMDNRVKKTTVFFGLNGFGNIPDDTYDYSSFLRQPENASQALVRLVKNFPNEITLIAVGTQTNLARAMWADADFGKYLKDCFIMGGNYLGVGNESPKAEFNFLTDPVAADIVVRGLQTPITIVTWELCLNSTTTWEWYDQWLSVNTPKTNFLKRIGQLARTRAEREGKVRHDFADQIAVALYLDSSIIVESQQVVARVETGNPANRGEMIVDWDSTRQNKNIKLVTKVDVPKILQLLEQAVQ